MNFERKKISSSSNKKKTVTKRSTTRKVAASKRPVRRKSKKRSVKTTKHIRNVVLFLLLFFVISGIVSAFVLHQKYIKPLPGTKELENLEISQTSIIYDKEGNELYNVFEEKRTYVGYEKINDNMINAIIAGEDKRYWENPGFDLIGLFRAVLYRGIGKSDKIEGTSTITQQLIRNTLIGNERKIERKIKEMYLSYTITKDLTKEKIIELYLNKISFAGNAYGIEQAAKTFFGKSAMDIDILESSILASLPKGPTEYSPYSHPDRLLGYPYVYNKEDAENVQQIIAKAELDANSELVSELQNFISGLKLTRLTTSKALVCGLKKDFLKKSISIDKDGCSVVDYANLLALLNGIRIESGEEVIEYQTGRKDFILGRMLEDNYIEFDDYKKSLLDAFAYEFTKNKEDIKYPHFVFYVKEYIEKKYGKDLLTKGGLRIYTTLDPKLQDKAEQLVESQAAINEASFGGKNAALVSIENDTGKIITMVGGRDYFDTENKGNVNIITSKLQPGSSFKPFVYALAFDQQKIGTKTPVYDLETEFPGDYTPANFDGEFKGKMNIMEALNNSRNIPAVKMFFVAGGESKIISFMERLGVNSIGNFKKEYLENYGKDYTYGASLALGTGMMTPLELATAYTVFANMGEQVEITPIEKILDSKGLVVEEYEKKEVKEAISPSLAYIMNYVLSNTSTRPESWNDLLALSDRVVAAKTGTSTKQYGTGDDREIFARNLWTAGYTPQVTTVVWAGNTDGKELGEKGSGLRGAGPIWKKFMEYYHQGKEIKSWQKLPGVKEVYISRISGLLPPGGLGGSLITPSYFLNEPTNYDRSLIGYQVDELCNGKVTNQTPEAAIKPVTLLRFQSLKPENSEWENPVQKWAGSGGYRFEFGGLPNIIGYISGKECERSDLPSDIIIKTTTPNGASFVNGNNFIELAYRSNHPIIRLDVFLGDSLVSAIDVQEKTEGAYKGSFNIDSSFTGSTTLSIRAVDNQYYSEQEVKNINILGADTTPPVITISEPAPNPTIDISDRIRVKGYVTDRTDIKSINIFSDGLPIKTAISGRSFNHMLNGADLGLGSHIIEVQAVDSALNKNTSQFTINVIETEQVPAVEEATGTEETSEETGTEETTGTGETSQ